MAQPGETDVEDTAEALPAPPLPPLYPTEGNEVLTLEDAQGRALQDNPSLKAAASRVEQAAARVRQARSLYFPQLEATYRATKTELPEATTNAAREGILQGINGSLLSAGVSTLFGANQTGENPLLSAGFGVVQGVQSLAAIEDEAKNYQGSLMASYLVFDGFSRRFTNAIARYGEQELEAAYRETQRLLLGAVAQSYFGVQLARENIGIARADEEFNQRLLRDAQARQRVGTGSLSDVLNFEVQIRAARATLLRAKNDYLQARIALAALMGVEEAQLPENTVVAELNSEAPEEMAAPEENELLEYMAENRPDLQQSELSVKRNQATVKQRKSAYFPTVGAFASKDAARTTTTQFESDDVSTSVGLNVSYTLFNGGRRKAEVEEARKLREEAEHLLTQAEIDARSDVRTALANLHNAQEQLLLARTTAEYVERNRALVEREYEAGQGALVRLNQAQRDLIEAQARLALARVSLRLSWQQLQSATGEILEGFAEAAE